jgi:hypothetical protein
MKSQANVRAQLVADIASSVKGHKKESAQYAQLMLRGKSLALLRLMLLVSASLFGLDGGPQWGIPWICNEGDGALRGNHLLPAEQRHFLKALLIRLSSKRLSLLLRPSVQRTNLRAESKWVAHCSTR